MRTSKRLLGKGRRLGSGIIARGSSALVETSEITLHTLITWYVPNSGDYWGFSPVRSRYMESNYLPSCYRNLAAHRRTSMSDADPLRTAGGSPMQFSYKRSRMPYQHPHTTPSERTGPPRSISFNSLPNPCLVSRSNSHAEGVRPPTEMTSVAAGSSTQQNQNHNVSRFRDALEYEDPDQRKREREHLERVERRKLRDGRSEERNPAKRHTDRSRETPKEERPPFELGAVSEGRTGRRSKLTYPLGARPDDREELMTAPKWGWLRPLPDVIAQSHSQTSPAGGSSALARGGVNVTDELTTGGLATLMLKLWFERDEKGHRRVPILLHRLRIRISDGLHPLDGNKAVFGIECEYPNGGARWVIYRELKEFISLHTHYALSNAYNRNIEALPEFPKTSKEVSLPIGVVRLDHSFRLTVPQILEERGEGERH